MIEQDEIVEEEAPPEPEAPADDPPPLGTGIAGDGPPDGFGLSGKGGGGGSGTGSGRRIGGGGRFDRSALMVSRTIESELKRNLKTRNAVFSGRIAIWVDRTGKVTRATPVGSLGSSAVEEAIRSDLAGIRFSEALPPDMPMPIQMRVSGRKPN